MIQKSFYIENEVYRELTRLAKTQRVPTAELMRGLIKAGLKLTQTREQQGTQFLLKLAGYKLKGGPKDLAKHHDRYTWE
jgi:hypothetical protein